MGTVFLSEKCCQSCLQESLPPSHLPARTPMVCCADLFGFHLVSTCATLSRVIIGGDVLQNN